MPESKRIVCLANSRKWQGRCVAGKEVNPDGFGQWIRPVSSSQTGELSLKDTVFSDGQVPKLLDVIQVPVKRHVPHGYQTENFLIDDRECWERKGTLTSSCLPQLCDRVGKLWVNGFHSINGHNDRIPNHTTKHLIELLIKHSITIVLDVRSQPHSRYNPQFNREVLQTALIRREIRYVFLGEELGARSKNPAHYIKGQVQYKAVAASADFGRGLDCIRQSVHTDRLALLCAEKDPLNCHRAILICRALRNDGILIRHILDDGNFESTAELEIRLLHTLKLPEQDLFTTREEMIERAYDLGAQDCILSEFVNLYMEEKRVIALFTIGFTKKSAEEFFTKLHEARVKRVIDIRLNNVSQLAGFAKKEDLRYFLRVVGGIDYLHLPFLAPTQELLDGYKKYKGDWATYEKEFLDLISSRKIEEAVSKELMDGACLLCSEKEPGHCHRRLAAEYLRDKWADVVVSITHLA